MATMITFPADAADSPTAAKPVQHRILVCEYSGAAHRLVEFSPEGKLTWEHKFPAIAVCFRMAGEGQVVFADGGSPTGIQVVNRDGKIIFDYRSKCEQILACDRLPNGNFLLAEQGPCQAVEVNAKGEIVSTVKLNTTAKAAHNQLRCIHQLENGHILACHEAEAVVREYDRDGKTVWEYPNITNVFEALRLANGNTLIGCGTDKRVIEVTPEKKIVWELTAVDVPELNLTWITSLQVLKNGNLVVANFLRSQEGKGAHAFEITRDEKKKVVWKYADHAVVKSITMIRVLDDNDSHAGEPVNPVEFKHARITDAWKNYAETLTFGRGQTLALVDDGCKLSMPEWTATVDGKPKVLVSYDSVDGDEDPKHEGKGYHGSTIGVPSSLNYQGKLGVAYNNQVAVIRALECCHCKVGDSTTLAAGLQWVLDNHKKYRITTVNLAPVDDLAHDKPVPTEIDDKLTKLREQNIWVSAPTGNHGFTNGISWPACQPNCFAIGAVAAGRDEVYLDRHAKVDLVVPAAATSSSNAIVCGAAMLLREAIENTNYDWKADGKTLPDAMLAIMQQTGKAVEDPGTNRTYRRLDVQAALEHVFAKAKAATRP